MLLVFSKYGGVEPQGLGRTPRQGLPLVVELPLNLNAILYISLFSFISLIQQKNDWLIKCTGTIQETKAFHIVFLDAMKIF